MICSYPWIGALTQRFGIRKVSAGGAFLAFAATLPFIYLASHGLVLTVLAGALFLRGMGLSAVGIPSISAAYASVRKQRPANGDNLAQHCAASRRTDFDYALRDLPGMEVGDGTVQRQPLQRIYRCLSSSLRTTCSPVCRRVETSAFHRQGDESTHCRGIVRHSGTHVRVIVRFRLDDEANTLQTNAFQQASDRGISFQMFSAPRTENIQYRDQRPSVRR